MANRKRKNIWPACLVKIREILQAMGATRVSDRPTADDERDEYLLQSPYGPVSVALLPPPTSLGGYGWVACQLLLFDAAYPQHWHGWDHWKQNLLLHDELTVEELLDAVGVHLRKFGRDRGHGFPSQETLERLAAECAVRRASWAKHVAALYAPQPVATTCDCGNER